MDAALHVVSRLRGMTEARHLARHLEYDWDPESTFARAALADLRIPAVSFPQGTTARRQYSEGDRDRWEVRVEIRSPMTLGELADHVAAEVARGGRWVRQGPAAAGGRSSWRIREADGSSWAGELAVSTGAEPGVFLGTLEIRRIDEARASQGS